MATKAKKGKTSYVKCNFCLNLFAAGRSFTSHHNACNANTLVRHRSLPTFSSTPAPDNSLLSAARINTSHDASIHPDDDVLMKGSDHHLFAYDSDGGVSADSTDLPSDDDSADEADHGLLDHYAHQSPVQPLADDALVPPLQLQPQQLFPTFHFYTVDDAVHLSLVNLCNELRAPQYAFDSILKWA
jgi:hypothetical protein